MISLKLLVFFLFVNLISASLPLLRPYQTQRPLRIDQHRKRSRDHQVRRGSNEFFMNEMFGFTMSYESNLRKVYELVEEQSNRPIRSGTLLTCDLVFAKNRLYTYSPAEWAIVTNNLKALQLFVCDSLLIESLLYHFKVEIFDGLLNTAIQTGNLEAFKIIYNVAYNVENIDLLSYAARHHVSDEFLYFLLDDCDLKEEIEYATPSGPFSSPLETAVKFNNLRAALIFIDKGASISTSIFPIFSFNRKRMLKVFLEQFSDLCCMKLDGNLLHHAARYSSDPGVIEMIFEKCPEIKVNELNNDNESPLDLCIESKVRNESILKSLLNHGADLTRNNYAPLETIIENRYLNLFKMALRFNLSNSSFIGKCIHFIKKHDAWQIFDVFLILDPEYIKFINPANISIDTLILEKAVVTFKLLLKSKKISIKEAAKRVGSHEAEEFMEILNEYTIRS